MKQTFFFIPYCLSASVKNSPLNHPNSALCTKKFVLPMQFLLFSIVAEITCNNQGALDLNFTSMISQFSSKPF